MLSIMEVNKEGERMPIIVLAEDAHAAASIKKRLHVERSMGEQSDRSGVLVYNLEGLQVVQDANGHPIDAYEEHLWSRTFGLAIVQPEDHATTLLPSYSCGVPTVSAVRAALGAAHATFNVTHLLFTHPAHYFNVAGNHMYSAMQHIHGHVDVLRVFTHGDQPLCLRADSAELERRENGCMEPYAMLVGVRGRHIPLLHKAVEDELLTDVCERGMESGVCVPGFMEENVAQSH